MSLKPIPCIVAILFHTFVRDPSATVAATAPSSAPVGYRASRSLRRAGDGKRWDLHLDRLAPAVSMHTAAPVMRPSYFFRVHYVPARFV